MMSETQEISSIDLISSLAPQRITKEHYWALSVFLVCVVLIILGITSIIYIPSAILGFLSLLSGASIGVALGLYGDYRNKVRRKNLMIHLVKIQKEEDKMPNEEDKESYLSSKKLFEEALRETKDILSDSLTSRGTQQWLYAHNRLLGSKVPMNELRNGNYVAVINAARSFMNGDYV